MAARGLPASPLQATWPVWATAGALCILWADLIHQLSYMWSGNEQYAFGYFVPLFAAGLFWRSWMDRPAPQAPPAISSALVPGLRPLTLAVALLLATYLPARIIHEVNQDWAFFSWLLGMAVVLASVYMIFFLGGWPWVRHFAFPLCFILVAVRWPYRIENSLTYRLMEVVSSLTVELLGWFNVPATQHGHLIEVATGTLGVDEACSGIRSFQSSLMSGLLLGELYRLRVWARATLLAGSIALAFIFNVIRTLILAWQANAQGLSAIDKWHDPAGLTILIACFFCLWTLAVLIDRFSCSAAGTRGKSQNERARAPDMPAQRPAATRARLTVPRWFAVSLLVWVPCVLLLNEAWYRSHRANLTAAASWWASFPTNLPSAREIPVSKLAQSKLKYDHGLTLAWNESDGTKWTAYCFRWNAGVASSRMSARDHRPEYCLGGSGYNCTADLGVKYLPAHGLELPFRVYSFERSGATICVFHCIWEDGAQKQEGFGPSKYRDRLKAVLQGRRSLGQQTLEIILSGYQDLGQAEDALRQRLPDLVQLGSPPGWLAASQQKQ